jgi:hypothetical protein
MSPKLENEQKVPQIGLNCRVFQMKEAGGICWGGNVTVPVLGYKPATVLL